MAACQQVETITMTSLVRTLRKVSSADGAIVLDLRHGTMFRVNQIGSTILDLVDQGLSLSQIEQQLTSDFAIPLEVIRTDIAQFMGDLRIRGLVESRTDEISTTSLG